MSTMPSVGSGTYSPGPNMVCSPEQEKVGTGSIEAIICPVYSDLRIRATVSIRAHDTVHTGARAQQESRKLRRVSTRSTPQYDRERQHIAIPCAAEDGARLGLLCWGYLQK